MSSISALSAVALAASLAIGLAGPAQAKPGPCAFDRSAMLALDLRHFDNSLDSGWHPIGDRPGCERAAADLIADYRKAHLATLGAEDLHGLGWHEGQLRAALGQTARAIALMQSVSKDADEFDVSYEQATIAFLRHDRPALLKARADLAAMVEPGWFTKAAADFKQKTGHDMEWPPNLGVVDGLIACFGKPYKQAYGACRPGG